MAIESKLINWLKKKNNSDRISIGIGDDAACVKFDGQYLVLKVDNLVSGVHFDPTKTTPIEIGKKAISRALSDIAAMAATPRFCLVSMVLPQRTSITEAKRISRGIKSVAKNFNIDIVGGDTSTHKGPMVISITIVGEAERLVTRDGARVGDNIYVTGRLGGSILGHHMDFIPQIALAKKLVSKYKITSMIDVSDGLVIDLSRLLEKNHLGALLYKDSIPVSTDAIKLSGGTDGLHHALYDGEDYELLFTSPQEIQGIYKIGEMIEKEGIYLQDGSRVKRLRIRGWEY